MESESNRKAAVSQAVENAAITRYKHRLDAKLPIRQRDLEHPSKGSLLGCLCTKLLLVILVTLFLVLQTMGYGGEPALANPLSLPMILTDLCVGWGMFGLASVFTYFYVRVKSPEVGIIMFVGLVVLCIAEFFIWGNLVQTGGMVLFPIIVIVVCLVPFVMDIWGLLTYNRKS